MKFRDQPSSQQPRLWRTSNEGSATKTQATLEPKMGVGEPTLRDLTFEWRTSVLEKSLHRLHLDDTVVCPRNQAQDILDAAYGYSMGSTLFSHLIRLQSTTRSQMKAKGMKDSTMRRWEKLIREAGVSLAMTDKVTLPALHVGIVDTLKYEQKVVSET